MPKATWKGKLFMDTLLSLEDANCFPELLTGDVINSCFIGFEAFTTCFDENDKLSYLTILH